MKLHNGSLYWPKTVNDIQAYPELHDTITCDVLIVGGGMSGALCAHTLSKYDLNTIVVEKRTVGSGSSSANTGLLQFSNDMMLHEFIKRMGEEQAVRFYKMCLKAVDELELAAKSLPKEVDFIRRKSLYYASTSGDKSKLKKEFKALSKHGFPAEFLKKDEIKERFGFEKPAALLTDGDAEVNPYKFIQALMEDAHHKGVRIFENTEIEETDRDDEYVYFQSPHGRIAAKKVIYSTGYETIPFAKKLGAEVNRTYAIVTTPVKFLDHWEDRSLIWETKRPYFYMRTTVDGRIVAGGLDEEKMEAPSSEDIIRECGQRLLDKIKEHYPSYEMEVDSVWGASFGESDDGLPFIGKHPKKDNVYYCLGFGGNGTVYSMLGAEILKDLILYDSHPDAEIVKLDR
ncbi:NAD(P)/FAD-dependent oxidoreductase [Peribacillus frigoritolerans]|uniref:NAD(P)/FAD-dependent oxidoreductase n=1 Tax=Peribacillus frigoritolerans TaxID=450367 RepID=UPI00105A9D7B|nr:FAD-dependent oxidoreductase [Peribacillus frigoritolerans]TDL79040.1 FAD-binding oxidoreductase [Peribacillus frigoritolerans]